jgi:uncharacterized membrane protein
VRHAMPAFKATLLVLFPALLVFAALLPPLIGDVFPLLSLAARFFFAPVCHQDAARSFWYLGVPLAVCARCFGIYCGAAIGLLFSVQQRVTLVATVVAVLANVLGWIAETVSPVNWIALRFLLGATLGMALGALLASAQTRLRPAV